MAIKVVCDICGRDASDSICCVPYLQTYYAEGKGGIKLARSNQYEICEMNFCKEHFCAIANFITGLKTR